MHEGNRFHYTFYIGTSYFGLQTLSFQPLLCDVRQRSPSPVGVDFFLPVLKWDLPAGAEYECRSSALILVGGWMSPMSQLLEGTISARNH